MLDASKLKERNNISMTIIYDATHMTAHKEILPTVGDSGPMTLTPVVYNYVFQKVH